MKKILILCLFLFGCDKSKPPEDTTAAANTNDKSNAIINQNKLTKARHRMSTISNAQEFYKELTGKYTMDEEHMFKLLEAAIESLIADSLFLGQRTIKLDSVYYNVNMNEGFEVRVDTTSNTE